MNKELVLILLGFAGQLLFFLRFLIQWYFSEKNKSVTVPTSFWYISIIGAVLLFIYSIFREDIVFMVGSLLSITIYVRNIFIEKIKNRIE